MPARKVRVTRGLDAIRNFNCAVTIVRVDDAESNVTA